MISMIWAQSRNGVIGKENALPWHLPNDLKHFKEITTGKKVLMGRKTFESIGKPLPNRENFVATRKEWAHEGVVSVRDIEEFLNEWVDKEEEVVVIGGGEIYNIAAPYADKLYITHVHANYSGDTYAPAVNGDTFVLKDIKTVLKSENDKNRSVSHSFCTYERQRG